MINQLWNSILDLLYPRKCVLCTKILSRCETDLCRSCRTTTERALHPNRKGKYYQCCYSVFLYKKNVATAVKKLKFSGKRFYGQSFGSLLAMKLLEENISVDIVTWAPVSQKRKKKRGYDQGEEIAKAVGKELGLPVVSLLRKVRHNSAQAMIDDYKERKANVANAYAVPDAQNVAGKRILLIDDVITTGATLDECSKVLVGAGASAVICGTFAAVGD